jgi:uncharacterized protein (DUF58 family)
MAGADPLRQRAEQIAATLPPLLVAAERVANTVAQGVHGRRRVGQGETFWQFRRYEAGDPPQLIDWRQSAKTDHVFIREMEWEAAQSVWIWHDQSPSMSWRSDGELPEKRERADLVTLALIALLVRSGEHVTLLGSGLRPATGRGSLARLAALVARGNLTASGENGSGMAESENSTPEPSAADDLPPVLPLPRYAQVVFVSDFLTPLEELDLLVRRYAELGVKGYLLQVLDPAEESLPYRGRVRFEGLEGEEPWLLSRVEAVRGAYLGRLEAQCRGIEDIARSVGWGYGRHSTDRPPQSALLTLYTALSQNLKSAR